MQGRANARAVKRRKAKVEFLVLAILYSITKFGYLSVNGLREVKKPLISVSGKLSHTELIQAISKSIMIEHRFLKSCSIYEAMSSVYLVQSIRTDFKGSIDKPVSIRV